MALKRHLPNIITLLNLFCGSIAVLFAVQNNFVAAALFVFLGIFFDFFDGLVARKLNVQSPLGLQLDSLADMVTSGLVPGIVMFKLLTLATNASTSFRLGDAWDSSMNWISIQFSPIALIGLLITLASAYRLAKFNLDEDQQSSFTGLPTPANALLILSLPLIMEFQNSNAINAIILNPWFLVAMTLLSCYMLNANIKLFALKFKDWGFKNNAVRYIFIVMCAIFIVLFKFLAIPIIIVFYVLLSLFSKSLSK
ncbi:CDP-diacylglycerol--serine O-phosphatidyltransferase [Gelidibacter algens]|uniref:CDP-diacylglycerol--serine O-phosphatidyltransferase n=1 Tax=Gelidibacter algens TaxID=49280 RepID=A0A1A7R0J0_9FLAO|nr:CDP-alcohol phosphatidyltransferase family protein [Gelidibacter algens]OBX25331.1 phosphatidylserine synthase [Gelidibacter algens]RAJ25205.1 CDP-diacylglycerol--serine O-phosphatidyltransferase [Gelidibacter algens]